MGLELGFSLGVGIGAYVARAHLLGSLPIRNPLGRAIHGLNEV